MSDATAITRNAAAPAAAPTLYTRPMVAICLVCLLGYGSQMVIQPILPILVLRQGGDATMVGLIIAAFSFPSVVLRPFMGRLVDEWSNKRVLAIGAAGIGLTGFIYLIPSLAVVFANRILHGAAWAAFNSGGHAMLARLAPPARRGEASSVYNVMPGIAQAVMPAVGLLLLGAVGIGAPFFVAAVLGVGAWALVAFGPLPAIPPSPRSSQNGVWRNLLERGAVVPMTLEFLFTSVSALYLVYPPVWATAHGIPLDQLALYYPVYGIVLVGLRIFSGRYVDRLSRRIVIAAGAVLAILSLAVASQAQDIAMLTVAGALYAAAASFTSPAVMAMAIDRSEPTRIGAAMATYSLGFQLALGLGAAVWGFVIDAYGFPAPYLVALLVQATLLVVIGVPWLAGRGGRSGPQARADAHG